MPRGPCYISRTNPVGRRRQVPGASPYAETRIDLPSRRRGRKCSIYLKGGGAEGTPAAALRGRSSMCETEGKRTRVLSAAAYANRAARCARLFTWPQPTFPAWSARRNRFL